MDVNDRELIGNVLSNIRSVSETPERFWTLSEMLRYKNYTKILLINIFSI
jgi:hypothetical protein